MNHLKRVEMRRNDQVITGRIVARREKTRQVYVQTDLPTTRHDDWYPESSWTEVQEDHHGEAAKP